MSRRFDAGLYRDSLRTQLWPIPLLALFTALFLGQLLPFLDRLLNDDLPPVVSGVLFGGGPEAARSLMETIAGSLVTVTSLTFSLTVVTLQLASSQFSPRLLRTFTRDRFVHNTLALFLATLVFALTVLRSIRTETPTDPGFVPEISVTVAFALAVASVVALVLFLAHLSRQIRVETMLRDVHAEANETMARIFPDDDTRDHPALGIPDDVRGALIASEHSGFLTRIDEKQALEAATGAGAVICVDVMPGDSLIRGVPFARVWGLDGNGVEPAAQKAVGEKLNAAVATGFERTSVQDAGFGLQQLLDVAARALSPGVNDPTTAVHAVGHISSVLCDLVSRSPGPKTLRDQDGKPRVVLRYPTLPVLLDQAMGQLLSYGMSDPRTAGRTLSLLREVAWNDSSGRYRRDILLQLARARAVLAASGLSEHEKDRLALCCTTVDAAVAGKWPPPEPAGH